MTLAVKVTNFRTHRQAEFVFKKGICHLMGDSGSGKTTVINAIRWCLYETGNKITPNGKKNAKTCVIVTYKEAKEEVVVTRWNSPRRVEYKKNGEVFASEEAQARIDAFFGSETLWHIIAYSAQLSLHPLISHGPTESTAAFFSLVDEEFRPKLKISNLETQLALSMKEKTSLASTLQSEICDHEVCPSAERIDISDLVRKQAVIREHVENISLNLRHRELSEKLDSLHETDSLERLEKERTDWFSCEKLHTRRQQIEQQLVDLVLPLTMAECDRELDAIASRRRQEAKCLGVVEYDAKIMETTLSKLKERRAQHILWKEHTRQREELQRKVTLLDLGIEPTRSQEDVEREILSIESVLSRGKGEPCPECGTLLNCARGILVAGGVSQDELSRLQGSRSKLTDELDKVKVYNKRRIIFDSYQAEIKALVQVSDPFYTESEESLHSLLMSAKYEKGSLYDEKQLLEHKNQLNLRVELSKFPSSSRKLEEIEGDIRTEKERLSIKKSIGELPAVGLSFSQYTEEDLVSAKREYDVLTVRLEEGVKNEKLLSLHANCDRIRETQSKLSKLGREVELLLEARDIAQEEYAKRISKTLDSVNYELDRLGPSLYGKDLRFQLELKRSGTKGNTVLKIASTLNGEEIDFSSIASGEKIRASIHILLACFSCKKPKFVILDEPLHSVEAKWVPATMETVRSALSEYICIFTSHTEMGEYIDHVVTM